MSINPNIHDTKFKASIIGLNKVEVYHYLYEVEVAYQEALERINRLANNNEQLVKQNHDNMLRIYNLQTALKEATEVPMETGEDSIEDTDDDATTVLTSSMLDEDTEDTTVLAQDEQEIEDIEDTTLLTDKVDEFEDVSVDEVEEHVVTESIIELDTLEDTVTEEQDDVNTITEDDHQDSTTIPTIDELDEDLFFGEIEDNSNKSFRIGDGNDEDAGLTFV